MKRAFLAFVSVFFALLGATACCANQAEDEANIRKQDEAYAVAYNNRDAKAVAALWSPDAVYLDPDTGEAAVGREEIEKMFAAAMADLKDAKLEISVESIKFVSPNVAIENGVARIVKPDAEPEETNYSAAFVRRDGQWLLDRVSEEASAAALPSNYEHLKELEWMIGSWVDQDENATIQTDCQWTKNQNFINRSFAVVVGDQVDMAGMQIIGWDPVAKKIRSWLFDSDGGFAEATWTHKGDRWVIQQSGTSPDGSRNSAVNIMTQIDENSFTWQSVNREVDGDILPNVDEVRIVRKSAEPTATAAHVDSSAANQPSEVEATP